MLKRDSIADAWKYYIGDTSDVLTPKQHEAARKLFYDGFGTALHFWGETHGAPDTYDILQKEFLSQVKTACANDSP